MAASDDDDDITTKLLKIFLNDGTIFPTEDDGERTLGDEYKADLLLAKIKNPRIKVLHDLRLKDSIDQWKSIDKKTKSDSEKLAGAIWTAIHTAGNDLGLDPRTLTSLEKYFTDLSNYDGISEDTQKRLEDSAKEYFQSVKGEPNTSSNQPADPPAWMADYHKTLFFQHR